MHIRRLGPADAEAFRTLRLKALRDVPAAFGSDYEETRRHPLDYFRQRLENAHMFAAEDQSLLIGCLAFGRDDSPKSGHRGVITAVYVEPAWRRRGVASALMTAAEDAAQGLEQLELFVSDAVPAALAFYRAHGFTEVGHIPNALRIDDDSYGERLMIKRLVG